MSKYFIGEYINYSDNTLEFDVYMYEGKEYISLVKVISFEEAEKTIKLLEAKDRRIAELQSLSNDWKQRFNASEKRYADLMQSNCECIEMKQRNFQKTQNNLAIKKLEELLKWVDKESDGDQKYLAPILIDKLNSMISELKGAKDE